MGTMVITDLDDTLLTTEKVLTAENIQSLKLLRDKGIIITIATGRPLHFIKKVEGLTALSDYFIASTGLGIWNCSEEKMIYTREFSPEQTAGITCYLIDENISFMRHEKLPDNHYCRVFRGSAYNDDLQKRERNFNGFCKPLVSGTDGEASLFMLPGVENPGLADKLKSDLKNVSVEIMSSPYNRGKYWIEILPTEVHKGSAVSWLRETLNIPRDRCIVIGNDHNDKTMLQLSERSYVVANALDELKDQFITTISGCDENGFSEAVRHAGLI